LAEVRSQEGESIENLLRRFKRKVQTEDIIKDVKRHSYYLEFAQQMVVKIPPFSRISRARYQTWSAIETTWRREVNSNLGTLFVT
jgi:small subunit ribosomal protein S21